MTVTSINYYHEGSEDTMFGPDPDNIEGVDIAASIDKYEDMLTAELKETYPTAKIEIERGTEKPVYIEVDDPETHEYDPYEEMRIDHIVSDLWQSWNWIIKK